MTDGQSARVAWHEFTWKAFLAALITIGLVILVLAFWKFGQVFLLIFAGILFAIFLRGLATGLSGRTGLGIGVSLAIVIGLLALAGIGAGFLLAPHIASQSRELMQTIPGAVGRVREWFAGIPLIGDAVGQFEESLQPGSDALRERLEKMFTATLTTVGAALFVIMIGIYLAVRPENYVRGLLKLLPMGYRERTCDVLGAIGHTLQRWLIGQVLVMIFVGTITAVGLALVDVPLALTLGIIAGLLDFIPNIGPWLAAIPGLLVAFQAGPEQVIYAGLVYIAVQHLEGYAFTPLIQQKMVYVEPALTLSAQLGFGLTMGALGLLLATPIVAAAMVAVKMLYIEDMLGDKVEVEGESSARQLCELQEHT